MLYLIGVELLQFGVVAHQSAIDIHYGTTLAQHLYAAIIVDHARYLAQHIVGRAQCGKHAILYAGHHGIALYLCLG